MTNPKKFNREAEIETLRLLFEKLAKRIQPLRYCEMKVVIHLDFARMGLNLIRTKTA